jgi:hypothetical protein
MRRASQPPCSTRACALAVALASVAACSLSQEGVMPPADTFFFPSSAMMPPDGQWLFVANSNADLRYNDGTVAMVNVGEDIIDGYGNVLSQGAATARKGDWPACAQVDYVNPVPRSTAPTCCWDALDSSILNCDERLYVQSDATVRIGSFAGGMAWQACPGNPCDPTSCAGTDDAGRLYVGVRGDTSLTWIDLKNDDPASPHPTLHCREDGTAGPLAECNQKVIDNSKSIEKSIPTSEQADPKAPVVGLPDEPYALEVDPTLGLLYVGHLVGNTSVVDSGGISLFDVGHQTPQFLSPFSSPFPANSAGSFGVTAITRHASYQGGSDYEIFVSSRYVPFVSSMVPFEPGEPAKLPPFMCGQGSDLVVIPAGETLNSGLTGSEMRGVQFLDPPPNSGTPQRAFALQRMPPYLVTFDITVNESGGTIPVVSSLIETCSSPTFLYKQPATGPAKRLYVNCFDTGEIYVFDAAGPTLLSTLQVGRGPGGMVFDPKLPVAYVLDFSQNDIVVVDLDPGSPTEDHVIQRIGFPSITPR